MVRRQDDKVRIYSRRGADFTLRFPRIVEAVRRLKVKSILLDGEGIVYDQNGMPSFDLIHSKQYDREVSLVAFDLLELDGDDVRKRPLLDRKARLAKLIAKARGGIEFGEHIEGAGADIFRTACSLGPRGHGGEAVPIAFRSDRTDAISSNSLLPSIRLSSSAGRFRCEPDLLINFPARGPVACESIGPPHIADWEDAERDYLWKTSTLKT